MLTGKCAASSLAGVVLGALAWLFLLDAPRGNAMQSELESGNAALAGVSVQSDPAPAMVFLNGVFVGETAQGKPLLVVASPGDVQLRIGEAGRLDAVFDTSLERGITRSFMAVLAATDEAWPVPTSPIRLSVGQPVRGKLVTDAAGKVQPLRYVIDEPAAPHRLLTLIKGSIGCRITDPEGKEVVMSRMAKNIEGSPGHAFYEYRGVGAGRYIMEITGNPGPFSFRFAQGLPPHASPDKPGPKGRREPPQPPGG